METERSIDRSAAKRLPIPPYPLLAEAKSLGRRNPRFGLRCLGCGYRTVTAELVRCPMCGDEAWDFAEWRPFQR